MKRLLIVLGILAFAALCFAQYGDYEGKVAEKDEKPAETFCPKTLISDNDRCMSCHVLEKTDTGYNFTIREVEPYSKYKMPYHTSVIDGKLTYYLEDILSDAFEDFTIYAKRHPEFGKHVIVEVDSFGGSIFQAWRIKALIVELEKEGYIIETRTRGIALSAGFMVFVSGTIGYRTADPNAEFMMHELWTIDWPKIATPASKEEEARTFRHLQDNINAWIASRGDMTAEEINKKVKFKEAWLTGKEMIKYRFADKYIGD